MINNSLKKRDVFSGGKKIHISNKAKKEVITALIEVIKLRKTEYAAEFLLRELLDHDYQSALNNRIIEINGNMRVVDFKLFEEDPLLITLSKKQKDRENLFTLIRKISIAYQIDFDFLVKLFRLIIDIRDFAFKTTLQNISNTHHVGIQYIRDVARMIFSDNKKQDLYKTRFLSNKYAKEILLDISDEIYEGEITRNDFSNLTNEQFQDVIEEYRQKKENHVLFTQIGVDIEFVEWLYEMSQDDLNTILKDHKIKLSTKELVMMCHKINKNFEVLKFIVYTLIKTTMSDGYIHTVTGKSISAIKNYERKIFQKRIVEKVRNKKKLLS